MSTEYFFSLVPRLDCASVKVNSSRAWFRVALSAVVSLYLLYTSLHISHSSHWTIMSAFFTCCTQGEKGIVLCLLLDACKLGLNSSEVDVPKTSSIGL